MKPEIVFKPVYNKPDSAVTLVYFPVFYGPLGESNIHRTFDLCPRPAKEEIKCTTA